MTSPFAFNTLVQPSATVTQSLPAGLDADMTYLLASATEAVVQAYLQGLASLTPAMLAALPVAGGAASYAQLGALFTASEALGLGATAATTSGGSPTPGAYVTVTIGAAIAGLDAKGNPLFTVIALRGTQTYQEWVNDATAIPQSFALVAGAGYVHSGFYAMYTVGTDGLQPSDSSRASGSLAAQINQAVTGGAWPSQLPLYITGHSLGAALAEICAVDVAGNMASSASSITMVNFAPPRASAGFLDDGKPLVLHLYDPTLFLQKFQQLVPSSYSIVNAADLVPILPPALGSPSGLQVVFYAVVPSANTVTFCAQLGDIGSNHELATSYLPYAQQLAAGFASSVITSAPVTAPRGRIAARATATATAAEPAAAAR